ncbi:hypothetical protein [Pendulispora albinea]|uniref:Uncharacterized protein n=1 Tax=Pendulispora albinea TaxID=2741071 RepID=A0ABZ2MAC3_9BACT
MSKRFAVMSLCIAAGFLACRNENAGTSPPASQAATATNNAAAAPSAGSSPAVTPAPHAAATNPAEPAQGSSGARARNFDQDAAGAAPSALSFGRTGQGKPGRWVIRAEADAPSKPNVLAQIDNDDTDNRFPVAIASEPSLRREHLPRLRGRSGDLRGRLFSTTRPHRHPIACARHRHGRGAHAGVLFA